MNQNERAEDLAKTKKSIKLTLGIPSVMCFLIALVMLMGDDPSNGWILMAIAVLLSITNVLIIRFVFVRLDEEYASQQKSPSGE